MPDALSHTKPAWFFAWPSIAALVFLFDQWSKYWLIETYGIAQRAPIHVTENFALVMAWNRGISFSMLTHDAAWMPWILILIALIITGLLVHLCRRSERRIERIGYAMVIGGALGNALDRARFGAVPDFFYAHIGELGWPAFNVADIGICSGVGLLLLAIIKSPTRA